MEWVLDNAEQRQDRAGQGKGLVGRAEENI